MATTPTSNGSDRRAKGCLIAAFLWIVILGVLAAGWRMLVQPRLSDRLARETGSASMYQDEITVAADSFSGYAILRSELVRSDLKARKIKLALVDDKADYAARVDALRQGKVQMAAFTIDSLVTACARAGEFPASIVLVIDETRGGDAIVANTNAIPTLQDLNSADARLVLTPDSPSEFFARTVLAHFQLGRVADSWLVKANGAAAVHDAARRASAAEKRAFVLWEPYVSRALEKPGMGVLIDSSKLRGFVVDVLVARREFLRDRPELVRAVIEAHQRAAHAIGQRPDGWVRLVRDDAKATGSDRLDDGQARKVVDGIQWKNTVENYAHFGLTSGVEAGGLPNLEDMIGNITGVLVKTKALPNDPLAGRIATLFTDRPLAAMRSDRFHPGQGLNLIDDPALTNAASEQVRAEKELASLGAEQWQRLRAVGELGIDPITFGRASANLTLDSERALDALLHRLEAFPRYYVRVIGHARADGDPEANRALAQARADAVVQHLVIRGFNRNRLRAEASAPRDGGGEAQVVGFFVGEVPY
jgi:ABC-type nitrate/sulfonate/bicarbonate transport system substrate-binding protein/outer membrane protein OmpA-like peptidoglycan-associated protein